VNFETICSRHAVIGDSEATAQALKELSQKTGATHFLTWHNIGSVPHSLVKESMEQFAREVMPRL
jgi:alkanesulfonate monooxygenase SsuD/methylene tetrahydromethanopterin reductase-like flavin-dependent oxidoreductase (luciferase family)